MIKTTIESTLWAVQAKGLPLFWRKTGKFGDLDGARFYQIPEDAQQGINYNGFDFATVVPVRLTCEIEETQDANALQLVLGKMGDRLGEKRSIPAIAARRAADQLSTCPSAGPAIAPQLSPSLISAGSLEDDTA